MPLNYSTLISGTNDNDSIQNFTDMASISALNGDDTIDNYGNTSMINAGTGNDYITNTGENVTTHAGTGNDSVFSTGIQNFIYTENDNDSIYNSGADSSINAGFGDDYIINDADHVAVDASNDNDTIENNGNNSTLLAGFGDDLINNWGADSSLNGGSGDDSLFNHASNVYIDGGVGDDIIFNENSNVIIIGNVGNDTIRNDGDYSSVDAGAGNDSIVSNGSYSTINVGTGDDTIDILYDTTAIINDGGTLRANLNTNVSTSIVGSRANDAIILYSSDTALNAVVTINTAAGNDSILASDAREYFQFVSGNDIIWNYSSYDTVHWTSGSIDQTLVGISDVTLVGTAGTLTLKDVIGKRLNVIDSRGDLHQHTYYQGISIYNSVNNINLVGSGGNDTVVNDGNNVSITTAAADDSILNTGSDTTISTGDNNDSITNEGERALINAGSGNDTVFNAYADNVTINAGRGYNTITNYGSNASINGGDLDDIIWNSGFKVISSGQILNSGQDSTINGGDGNDTIISYGPNVVINAGDRADSIQNFGNFSTINGDTGDDLIINRGMYVSLNGGDGYDSITNHGDFSTLDGGNGNDTLVGDNAAIETFRYSTGDDIIFNYGREDTIKLDVEYLDTNIVGRDFIIYTNDGSLTVKNAANMSVTIRNVSNRTEVLNEDNDELATLAVDDTVDNLLPDGASYDIDRTTIYVNSAYISQLDARLYAQTVTDIDASKMKTPIEIVGNDNDNVIRASNGGSVIRSGAGSNTLVGGSGDDIFLLSATSSNNVIDNYSNGDIIQLAQGQVVDSSINGSDILLQLSSGTITLKRAANKEIRIIEADVDTTPGTDFNNFRNNVTVNGSADADNITNYGDHVLINALGGNDSIISDSRDGYVTINAGEGDDSVQSSDNNAVIYGGVGDDYIYSNAGHQTIVAGTGNDTINAIGSRITYDYTNGDGNDLILNYTVGDVIQLHNIAISGSSVDGDDVILRLGNGFITLSGAVGKNVSFIGTRGDQFTETFNPPADDTTSAEEDTTTVEDDSSSIEDDTTTVEDDSSSVEEDTTSVEDDTTTVEDDSSSVEEDTSTVEDDTTTVEDDTTTVEDDTTTVEDDTTTVEDDTTSVEDDTTSVEDDTTSVDDDTTSVDDDTTSVEEDTTSVEDDSSSVEDDSSSVEDDTTVEQEGDPLNVIKNFMGALDRTTLSGSHAVDQAIKACSSYSSAQDAIDAFISDCQNAESPNAFLRNSCGIILGNTDTGAIIGSDAGGSIIKSAESIVPENPNDSLYPDSTSFTINGLTVNVPERSSLTTTQQNIVKGLYNWWIKGALDLNLESYGLSFNEDGTTVNTINVRFNNDTTVKTLASVSYSWDSNGVINSLNLIIPMSRYDSITDDDVNGYTNDGHSYLDRTIAHEFTHALMAANINGFRRLPAFVTEGLAELTHGIDDIRGRQILELAGDVDQLSNCLDVERSNVNSSADYSAGFMFFRWLAKQFATFEPVTDNSETVFGTNAKDTFYFDGGNLTIVDYESGKDRVKLNVDVINTSVDGADVIFYSNSDTLTVKDAAGSKLRVVNNNGKSSNTIYDAPLPDGASFNSTHTIIKLDKDFSGSIDATNYASPVKTIKASNSSAPVTIRGNQLDNAIRLGKGSGLIAVGNGNDSVYKYNDGYTLSIEGGITDSVVSDKNLIINTNQGSVTIVKGNGININITEEISELTFDADQDIDTGIVANDAGTAITVDNDYAADSLNVGAIDRIGNSIITVDASNRSDLLNIVGNFQNNVVSLGSGGGYVNGGTGRDSFFLGSGNDTVVFSIGSGLDSVYQYDNGDIISLSGISDISGQLVFPFIRNDNTVVSVSLSSSDTIALIDPYEIISFAVDSNIVTIDTAGITFANNLQAVTLGSSFNGSAFNANHYSDIVSIDASAANVDMLIYSNQNNNLISLGSGVDTVVHSVGGGRDSLYGYDGDSGDLISLVGASNIDARNVYSFGNGRIAVSLSSGDTLSLSDASEIVNLAVGNSIVTVDTAGITFTANLQSVTLTNDYNDTAFDASDYASLASINAEDISVAFNITGNSLGNTITVGSGGGLVDGNGGNDRIILGGGADTVVHSINGERITLDNYDSDSGDLISLSGDASITGVFPFDNNVLRIYLGTDTIALNNPSNGIIALAIGDSLSTIDVNGLAFSSNLQTVSVGSDYNSTVFDANEYVSLSGIDASERYDEFYIVGNSNNNFITVGNGNALVDGNGGNDRIQLGDGADTIVHSVDGSSRLSLVSFNADNGDLISVVGNPDFGGAYQFANGNIAINLGDDTISLIDSSNLINIAINDSLITVDTTGLIFSRSAQAVTIDTDFTLDSFDGNSYSSLRSIDALAISTALDITANSLDNDISVGSGGGFVDGAGGNDRIQLGDGADTIVHSVGSGLVTVYGYNAESDLVSLIGRSDSISQTDFVNRGNGVILLNLGDDTIFFRNLASNNIVVNYGSDDDPQSVTFDPNGLIFSTNQRSVTVSSDYQNDDSLFDAGDYSILININASPYFADLNIIGNSNDNNITVASGGSVDGGAGDDLIYAGDGNDIIVFTLGSGNDTIFDFGDTDVIHLYGIGTIDNSNFVPVNDTLTLVDLGTDTLTLINANKQIAVEFGSTNITDQFTADLNGITINNERTAITVDDNFNPTDFNLTDFGSSLVSIDASNRTTELNITANNLQNFITLGSGGGIIEPSSANDFITAGDGADVFIHSVGSSGNDTISNFNSNDPITADVIQALGIDSLDKSAFALADNNIVRINLGNDTITLLEPSGVISVVDENNNELNSFDPSGSSIYGDRALNIDSNYNDTIVDASNYSSLLTVINADKYTGDGISIVGNSNNNIIRAGIYNNTLDGGAGTDSLYGDAYFRSIDTFVVTLGSGTKHIFNYSTTLDGAEDVVALVGAVGEIDSANFNEVGSNTTLSIGSNQIIFHNPRGSAINLVDQNGNEIFTYDLPDGVTLSDDKSVAYIDDDYADTTFNASDFNSSIKSIFATNRTLELEIIGNSNDNIIHAGPGGGTLDGNGSGSNKLYGSDGVDVFRITPGKSDDTIYNFDASDLDNPDVIIVDGVDSLNRDAIQLLDNGYVQVSIGGGMLTLINSKGPVSVLNEEGAELTSFDTTGITLSSDNRTLNVSDAYPNSVLTADNFSSLVATIEAANRTEPISIVGNSNSNVIKAGSGGSTLNGGGYIDHLYGGNGADLFQYQFGDSNDVIYNFNSTSEGAIDAIQILGYSGTITRNNFRDSANGNTIIQIGTNTLTLVDPVGAITVFGEDIDEENPFVYSSSLPSGVTYNFNKTKLNVSQNADLDDEQRTFYVENFSNNLKTIDASKYPDAVTLIGDSKANELYAGSGGSSMDGGAAVDKLYGGEGADTFVWQIGEGNDYIFYYSAVNDDAMDVVQILGDTSAITKSSFRDSGKNVVLSMGNSQLTLVEPEGSIKLIDEDGEEIISYDQTLPSGVSYSDNKQNLTIARGTTLENPEFDMDSLANNLRNIDGSAYEGELYLRGNRYANVLRAGSGGSTLEGKAGTDRLYGGNGRDVFVLTVGGGNDVIYNYNGDQEDVIQVLGSAALTNNSFIESNGNVYMQLGNEKVMLASPTGGIEILDENGDELFTYGSSLPSGVHYTDNRTTLVIGENADLSDDELEFSVASYGNNLRNIDASAYDANALVLAGDSYVNSLRAGGAGSSINGGTGADYLYGGAGADTFAYMTGDGNDYIFNYNGSAGDVLQYLGSTTIYRSNFQDQGGNVVLTIGTQRLTFVDAWGPIVLVDSDGDTLEATYDEVLPSGITYNSSHTKLTVGNIDQMENPLLDMATLSNNIRDIDATSYGHEIVMKGNDRSNELRAGSGGSSLDGGDGADKLYGGAGADTYVVSVGAGSDQIFNYNGNDGDIIQVYGVRTLTRDAFTDSGSNVRLNLGSERIVLRNPSGTITVMLGDNADETITYGADLPSGVSYSTDKTTLTISRGASLESELFDMATLSNSLRNINGENYEGELNLVGNDKANELHGGSGGSTLDGGAGNDKLYGGTGSDTFIYESGGGNDYIYNYSNADGDVIKLVGVSALDSSAIRESGRNTIVTIGTERLTLVNVSGQIAFVDENDNELLTYGMDLPTGISYNASKTKLTIARGADLTDGNEFDMSTLASNIRDIDASAYDGEIALTGNDRANDLKAGSGGSTLNGGEGNDKLYGGEGADVFVYEYGTGNDHIYNYSDGDTIQLIGVNSIEKSDFRESGRNAILTIGDNRLTIHNSPAQLIVVDESGAELITYAETLPSGVSYNSSKSALAVSSDADLSGNNELNVADYVNKLKDINASSYTGAIVLTGDDKANELRAGSGGSTLSGGAGNDKLYAGTGADEIIYSGGNDVVYHFNVDNDSVTFEADLTGSRISGSDIVYQTDNGTLTIKNVASYGLSAITINENSAQLAADEYWFEPSTTDDDPLNGLMAINEGVELPTDDPIDQLKASTTALALNTRHKARFNR